MSYKYFITVPDNEINLDLKGDYQIVILKIHEDFIQNVFDTIKTTDPQPRLSYNNLNIDDSYIECDWIDSKEFHKHNSSLRLGEISEYQYNQLSYNKLSTNIVTFNFDGSYKAPTLEIICDPSANSQEELIAFIDLSDVDLTPESVKNLEIPLVTPPNFRKSRWVLSLIGLTITAWIITLWSILK
jgi:hypothetical protein